MGNDVIKCDSKDSVVTVFCYTSKNLFYLCTNNYVLIFFIKFII